MYEGNFLPGSTKAPIFLPDAPLPSLQFFLIYAIFGKKACVIRFIQTGSGGDTPN